MSRKIDFDKIDSLDDEIISQAMDHASEVEKLAQEREALKRCISEYESLRKLLMAISTDTLTTKEKLDDIHSAIKKLTEEKIPEEEIKKAREQYNEITKETFSELKSQFRKKCYDVLNGWVVLSPIVFYCLLIAVIFFAIFYVCAIALNCYLIDSSKLWELIGVVFVSIGFGIAMSIYFNR